MASTVSVLVIDCTRTGASPPTVTTRLPSNGCLARTTRLGSDHRDRLLLAVHLLALFHLKARDVLARDCERSNGAPRTITSVALTLPTTTDKRGWLARRLGRSPAFRGARTPPRPRHRGTCTQDSAVARNSSSAEATTVTGSGRHAGGHHGHSLRAPQPLALRQARRWLATAPTQPTRAWHRLRDRTILLEASTSCVLQAQAQAHAPDRTPTCHWARNTPQPQRPTAPAPSNSRRARPPADARWCFVLRILNFAFNPSLSPRRRGACPGATALPL